jgi:chemotaxis protein CheX
MDTSQAPEDARPVEGDVRDLLLVPFLTAVRDTLAEMSGLDTAVRVVYRTADLRIAVGVTAAVELDVAKPGCLVLEFPRPTAAALAERVLAGVPAAPDDALIGDCVGEIANVVAGRAKTMLAATGFRFAFRVPRIVAAGDTLPLAPGQNRLVAVFDSPSGEFALQLFGFE